MTYRGYNKILLAPGYTLEVLTNTDKARIVVVAILDVSSNGNKLYRSTAH